MNQRVKEKNKWIDRLINFVFYGCVLALIWLLLQITTFSSFRIPTASMHPTLIKGDYVIVNKWIAGGRIFNVFNAVKNKHISIKRIPGIRRIRKNDILIFHQSGNIRIEYILMSCNIMLNDVWGFRVTLWQLSCLHYLP